MAAPQENITPPAEHRLGEQHRYRLKTPGSPYSSAPRTRNSIPSSVLPQPALPQISVGRPFGSPPHVISSSPAMPVGVFASVVAGGCGRLFALAISKLLCYGSPGTI